MNMPTEDGSEGLFISPLLPYAKIVKTFLMTVFSFQTNLHYAQTKRCHST